MKYLVFLSLLFSFSPLLKAFEPLNVVKPIGKFFLEGRSGVAVSSRSLKLDGVPYFGSHGIRVEGGQPRLGYGSYNYDLLLFFNIRYETLSSWVSTRLRSHYEFGGSYYLSREGFPQPYGLLFQEAYFGTYLYEKGEGTLSVELGRKQLNRLYHSSIQFDLRSKHDGIVGTYKSSFPLMGEGQLTASTWIHNASNHWYPWAAEIYFKRLFDTSFYAYYSYISWLKKERGMVLDSENGNFRQASVLGARFYGSSRSRNSQWTLGYSFPSKLLGAELKLEGAYLINHAVKTYNYSKTNLDATNQLVSTGDQKENTAYYLQSTWGKLSGKGTWQLLLGYQHVRQNAVLYGDYAGIGRFNRMGTNCKGYMLKGALALSDSIDVSASLIEGREIRSYPGKLASLKNLTGAKSRRFKRASTEMWIHF